MSSLLATALAVAAAVTDLARHRIPNRLTYPALVLGLVVALWPAAASAPALGSALLGLLVGGGLALSLFVSGSLGGGDVKLLAALGLLLGLPLIVDVLFYTLIYGAAVSLAMLLWRRRIGELLQGLLAFLVAAACPNSTPAVPPSDLKMPLGFAIGVACLTTIYLPQLRVSPGLTAPLGG